MFHIDSSEDKRFYTLFFNSLQQDQDELSTEEASICKSWLKMMSFTLWILTFEKGQVLLRFWSLCKLILAMTHYPQVSTSKNEAPKEKDFDNLDDNDVVMSEGSG